MQLGKFLVYITIIIGKLFYVIHIYLIYYHEIVHSILVLVDYH